jgi:hypothetical protein
MDRVTSKDVRQAFARLCQAHPVTTAGWTLQEGSPSNGRAWRLFARTGNTGGLSYAVSHNGYIGWNAREALEHVRGLHQGMDLQAPSA